MTSYDPISIDKQVLGFVLDNDFFSKVSNIVTRDMFTGEMRDVFDVISYAHTQYASVFFSPRTSACFFRALTKSFTGSPHQCDTNHFGLCELVPAGDQLHVAALLLLSRRLHDVLHHVVQIDSVLV